MGQGRVGDKPEGRTEGNEASAELERQQLIH